MTTLQCFSVGLFDQLGRQTQRVCLRASWYNLCSIELAHFDPALLLSQVPLCRLIECLVVDQVHDEDV